MYSEIAFASKMFAVLISCSGNKLDMELTLGVQRVNGVVINLLVTLWMANTTAKVPITLPMPTSTRENTGLTGALSSC